MARLPIPGSDNGSWGAILNAFLDVEHNADGTLKIRSDGTLSTPTVTSISFKDVLSVVRGSIVSVSGDLWILSNATWDASAQEFYRIDKTKASFGLQLQGQGFIPGEPDLGFLYCWRHVVGGPARIVHAYPWRRQPQR